MIGFVSETAVDHFRHALERHQDRLRDAGRAHREKPTSATLREIESCEQALAAFRKNARQEGIRL